MANPYRGPSVRADFEDILDTIRRDRVSQSEDDALDRSEAAPPSTPHANFDFLQALDGVSSKRAMDERLAAGSVAGSYEDASLEAAAEDAPPPPSFAPEQAARGEQPSAKRDAEPSPLSLAAELGLRAGLKPAELRRLRRAFALENHPDRLAPSRREAASRRMTIANSLIDEALRRARAAH